MDAKTYAKTRFTMLDPRKSGSAVKRSPLASIRQVNLHMLNNFGLGFFSWSWDAFDFFVVSLTIDNIAEDLEKTVAQISWGITLTLMLRSVGSILFGLAADRYGRKWPMLFNLFLFSILEIGLGFVKTFPQFLGVRALFGIAMGGIYGMANATALEDIPVGARGFFGGMLQQGYAFGYLLATVFYRAVVPTTTHGWRSLAWFSAGPPILIMLWRLFTDETDTYKRNKAAKEANQELDESLGRRFVREGKNAVRSHGFLFVYLVLLMTGANFLSHGSQDVAKLLIKQKITKSANGITVALVLSNVGAITGGMTLGLVSDYMGRRLTMLMACCVGLLILPVYIYVSGTQLIAGLFFEQFCVQGFWGVIAVHLIELAPADYRTFVVGTAYQIGNLISSASATIETEVAPHFPLPKGSRTPYNYAFVIAYFLIIVYAYLLVVVFVGPEKRAQSLDSATAQDAEVAHNKEGDVESFDEKHQTHDTRREYA